ncbi:hypothetical protein JTE90_026736 [Oedothorax gibbosus]|uniref:Exonuclease domain-containing protein n=1 Tax=Oedothorax gibbosus TaxID=931172 RepID=A0AAV6U4Q6_9ARAC|nr:hypothetical protein JTE90_026736 [Oedothorax gibbosus]
MEANSENLKTFNVRKNQRFESKKRKLEALLNLFHEDKDPVPKPKKKQKESLEKSYKDLKDELKNYIKKPEVEPNFYLSPPGLKAKVSINSETIKDTVDPLFIEDIYLLLLRSAIGHQSPFPVGWAKLEQPQNVAKTVLLVVEGITKSDVIKHRDKLSNIEAIFKNNVVEIASSNDSFASQLCNLHQVTDFHLREKNTYSTMFPKDKEVKIDAPEDPKPASKLHLLLSPIQMAMENYPFPQSVFQHSQGKNYVFSKDAYNPVTDASPLFALDCEMCLTDKGKSELTRIAVIDEKLETVYHTLVKPHNNIVDYLTRYSGITESMLLDVETRLSDVQKHLQTILPPDVILCGQSLNVDLHALQMIHPYVIDTSLIFNSCGIRGKKDSLKSLALRHLDERIQNKGKAGHDPIEDAVATMKLVLLKLENGVQYGDACFEEDSSEVKTTEEPSKTVEDSSMSFFARLRKHLKKCCLIGSQETLNQYDAKTLPKAVQKYVKSNCKKVLKTTLKHLNEYDFVVSHFVFADLSEGTFEELNNILVKLHEACGNRTMLTALLSETDKSKFADIKSGLFMATLKKINDQC